MNVSKTIYTEVIWRNALWCSHLMNMSNKISCLYLWIVTTLHCPVHWERKVCYWAIMLLNNWAWVCSLVFLRPWSSALSVYYPLHSNDHTMQLNHSDSGVDPFFFRGFYTQINFTPISLITVLYLVTISMNIERVIKNLL